MKKVSAFSKLILIVALFIILALVAVQLYNYFFLSVQTEYAVRATMEDTFDVNGVFCRTEHILTSGAGGYLDVVLEDGEKVSKGGTIANVYAKEQDVKAQEQIRYLQAEIDDYNAAITAKASYSGDGSAYEHSIQSALSDYSAALSVKDSLFAQQALEDFEKSVFIKEIVSGKNEHYDQTISELKAEMDNLRVSIGGAVRSIKAAEPGFFSRTVDGYENLIMSDVMSGYTLADYNTLLASLQENKGVSEEGALGKIITGYEWQYYFTIPSQKMEKLSIGSTIYLRFPSVSDHSVAAEIVSLNVENDTALVGVSCSAVNSRFLSARTMEATVITKTYSGIRVDKDSIRIVDGKNGLYVKVGSIVKFKKVDILYMGTTYALIDSENSSVNNYDEIIIGGHDIYDGKIL